MITSNTTVINIDSSNTTKQNNINNNSQPFPIDLVYTWVNSSDPKWIKSYREEVRRAKLRLSKNNFDSRYNCFEELRYSLRTVEKFALPMINKIYIITANQIPKWINQDLDIIKFVFHPEIFPNHCSYKTESSESLTFSNQSETANHDKCLPTFNSNAIDFSLINIPNLSEHFIYCNDDMYFGNYVDWSDFFDNKGRPKFISKDKEWHHVRSETSSYNTKILNNEQGGKQFTSMVLNTINIFMNKFKLKDAISAEFSHIPFPMTKSLFNEVIHLFTDNVDNTIQSKFRSVSDLQMENLMIQYGLYSNKAVKIKRNSKNCRFFVTDTEEGFYNLVGYVKNKPKTFCINTDSDIYKSKIQGYLDNLVGNMSIFEKEDLSHQVDPEDKIFWFLDETKEKYEFFRKRRTRAPPKRRKRKY